MHNTFHRITILITLSLSLLITEKLSAQTYQFKVFDSSVGLPQNFVYCLAQSNDGYMWMGTGEGLVRYDGIKFQNYTVNDSLCSDFIRSLFVDSKGKLWVGHENGGISFYDRKFKKIQPEGLSSPIRDICEDHNGNIWIVEQNHGIIRIDQNLKTTVFSDKKLFGRKLFNTIEYVSENTFLVGTSEGLIRITFTEDGSAVDKISPSNEIPEISISSIVKRKSTEKEYWIATEGKGFYLYSFSKNSSQSFVNNQLCLLFNIQDENIADIVEEDAGHLLLATWGNGVIKLLFNPSTNTYDNSLNFSQANGLNNNYIKDVLYDREGNYWLATYGGGVSALMSDCFIYYPLQEIGFKNNKVNSVFRNTTELWMGLDNGILKADPFCYTNHEFYDQYLGIPNDNISGFYQDDKENLWVATNEHGLYKRRKGTLKFEKHFYTTSILGNQINDIDGDQTYLYLATMGGLYVIERATNQITHLTTEKSLPHNNINFVYRDNQNRIWIGPKSSGICKIDIKNLQIEVHRLDQTPVDVSDLTEDSFGNLWLATKGKGVLKYTEDTLVNITVQNGLAKNFCYSIAHDSQNRLWICHHPGLSSIDLNTMKIRTFAHEQNMGGDFHQVWKDRDNTLWFGSSDGVIHYFPDLDKPNTTPPILNFTSILINGKEYPADQPIKLPYPYNKNYNFKFDFIGISFKNPKGVTYKYKLEKVGDESSTDWIDLGYTNSREYEFLPDGDYILKILTSNADGISSSTPLSLAISIQTPIWKRGWFYLVTILLVGYLIYLLIRYRERQLLHQKEMLQNEVASQTILLRNQKAEIERKNRDITDSINYAKRIQTSVLPNIAVLKNQFPESFVFYAPRDIVSGDFYWFNQTREYFLVACADCTGHGVPGAFMSMIGSTLLSDIFKDQFINSPAEILQKLDHEIKILLQKNSVDQTQDGMDISIVEIHMPTNRVRLASAKRPVFLYINDELTIYKGARRSIGDTRGDQEGEFVNIEYHLSKGDKIYLFSDGYTDQFGGPLGKKFMKVGIQNLIESIHKKPMNEQYAIAKDNFLEWKGNLEQVDDVVFLGIKL